jgi:hypothetical protein
MVMLILGMSLACGQVLAAPQPAMGPIRALQRLAERQGHPAAAARDLRNFGYEVPPEIEAAALGITPEVVRRAIEAGGPLTARLESVRGRPLSADQVRRVGEAERQYARQLAPLRQKLAEDAARLTGLPDKKVRKIFARDDGTPAAGKKAIAELEKQLGRRLSAGDANRLAAAREEFRAATLVPRSVLAQQAGKIAGIPQTVVQELLR